MLSKARMRDLFEKLNGKLRRQGTRGEIGIVGGAVMCLLFDVRASTKDVDGIFEPSSKIRKLAREIAREEGIADPDWLNDGAKAFIQGKFERVEVMTFSHLTIWAPEPNYILAMKCISARFDTNDSADVRFLISHLNLNSPSEVLDIVAKFYPKQRIPAKAQFFVEELFGN